MTKILNKLTRMECVLLETLSFYEFMNMEKVIFDLDSVDSCGLTMDDVTLGLESLIQRKMVILKIIDKESLWKRQIPPKSFFSSFKKRFF